MQTFFNRQKCEQSVIIVEENIRNVTFILVENMDSIEQLSM